MRKLPALKKVSLATLTLSAINVILLFSWLYINHENNLYEALINDSKEQIYILNKQIVEMKPMIEKVEKIQAYIDIDNPEQLNETIIITEKTPLDLYTSSVIVGYSDKFKLRRSMFLALIERECDFDQYAKGYNEDRGYGQLIPGTEEWLANAFGHKIGLSYDPSKIYEPEYNIGLTALYLDHLNQKHDGDPHKILTEYNRGPYKIKSYYNKHKTYETAYSSEVIEKMGAYKSLDN